MNRRDVFKLTTLAGAVPLAAVAQSAGGANATTAPASAWKPEVLDAHQNETLIALSDLIIPDTDTPGAKAANVNRYVDLFLRDGDPAMRERLISGMGWLDGYAIAKSGAPFVRLSRDQQTAVLTDLDSASAGAAGADFFRLAKSIIARIYYNTAIGYRELNKGGRVPSTFGCRA